MSNLLKIALVSFLLSMSVGACKKGDDPTIDSVKRDIYVAFTEKNLAGKNVANYLKNETSNNLTNGAKDASADAIFVAGTDVYVAGEEDGYTKIWKNGEASDLNTIYLAPSVTSIFVSGDVVYVTGLAVKQSTVVAKYWQNGVAYDLTNGNRDAVAASVYVVGSDAYMVGYEKNADYVPVAKLWKNGFAAQDLSNGTTAAAANSVFVQGSVVYVCGYEKNAAGIEIAKLWENGVATNLTDGTKPGFAHSVFVDGNDVYVVGTLGSKIVLWENGIATDLTNGTNNAYVIGLQVIENEVYVLGAENSAATPNEYVKKIWKNGTPTVLANVSTAASASAFFVK